MATITHGLPLRGSPILENLSVVWSVERGKKMTMLTMCLNYNNKKELSKKNTYNKTLRIKKNIIINVALILGEQISTYL